MEEIDADCRKQSIELNRERERKIELDRKEKRSTTHTLFTGRRTHVNPFVFEKKQTIYRKMKKVVFLFLFHFFL